MLLKLQSIHFTDIHERIPAQKYTVLHSYHARVKKGECAQRRRTACLKIGKIVLLHFSAMLFPLMGIDALAVPEQPSAANIAAALGELGIASEADWSELLTTSSQG